ncbi:hypothetical protein ETB97_010547, partial [Aspergillus alliaceus]
MFDNPRVTLITHAGNPRLPITRRRVVGLNPEPSNLRVSGNPRVMARPSGGLPHLNDNSHLNNKYEAIQVFTPHRL